MAIKDLVPMWLRHRVMDLRGRGIYAGYPNRHRCIFIHVPKAAGSSVALTLFGEASRHVPYFVYEQANPRKFRAFFKFAFVRNPWDRVVSTYFFLKKGGMNELDRQWAAENLNHFSDFNDFVLRWLDESRAWSWVHFIPQHYFLCDKDLNLKMDFVGRMENMDADFQFVAKQLGCTRRLEAVNRGSHAHYSEYYTPETIDAVARVYRQDIKLFGYQFEATPG